MPSFELSGPDGGTYRVEAADEASAREALQSALGEPSAASQPSAPSPAEGESSLWGVGKSLGTGVAEGVIGVLGLPGDLYHVSRKALGYSEPPEAILGSHWLQKKAEQYTGEFYHPHGWIEETVNKAGQFLPALIGGPETLAARAVTRVLAPAGLSEAAGRLTEGTPYRPYAEALAAVAGGAGAASASARLVHGWETAAAAEKTMPNAQKLLDTAAEQFNEAQAMQAEIAPAARSKLASDIRNKLTADQFDMGSQNSVFDKLDRLERPGDAANTVESVRRRLVDLTERYDVDTALAARKALGSLHEGLAHLSPRDFVSGDGAAYTALIRQAADNWAAGQRADLLSGRVKFPGFDPALMAGGKPPDLMRQAAKALLRPGRQPGVTLAEDLGFTAPEIEALNAAQQQTRLAGATGKLDQIVSHPAATALPGAKVASGATTLAKNIGQLSNDRAVKALDSLVRSRSPLAVEVAAQLPPTLIRQLSPAVQALLLGSLQVHNIANGNP